MHGFLRNTENINHENVSVGAHFKNFGFQPYA